MYCSNYNGGSPRDSGISRGMWDLGRLAIPSMGISKNRLDKHLSVITRLGLTPSWLSPGHSASQFSTVV